MRNSFVWRIAIPYLILVVLIMGALGWFLSSFMERSYLEQLTTGLTASTRLFANQVAPILSNGAPYPGLADLTIQASLLEEARITVILPDGTVIAERSSCSDRLGFRCRLMMIASVSASSSRSRELSVAPWSYRCASR